MAEKKHSIEDIRRMITEAQPKYICLEDSTGSRIIPFNFKDVEFKKHLDKICLRLKSEILNDGNYFVCFGETNSKGASVSKIPYIKGEVLPAAITIEEKETANTMSQDKIIELIRENANLKSENGILENENKHLQSEIEALEDEIAEMENKPAPGIFGMGEGLQNKIGDLVTVLAQKWAAGSPPPLAEAQPSQPTVSYDQILNILKQNPAVVDQLRNDLSPQQAPATNGQQH